MNGPFFNERGISLLERGRLRPRVRLADEGVRVPLLLSPAILDDHVARTLIATRLVTACRLSPRGHRMTSARGFTFTTTVRVIDRVHRDTADLRTPALPAAAACFTKRFVLVLGVADLSDGRHADDGDAANFT